MIEEDRKSLGMTIGKAHKIISKWTKDYKKANKNARQLKILLTDGLKIGDGISQQDMGNNHITMMGMHPYSLSEKISAEYRGVMSMWAQMEQMYPDDADRLMLERLTERAKNTNYILKAPKDRFTSKTQVKFLFHRAAIERPSGREMDLKMAALVLYIHPELYGRYPEIDARHARIS